MTETDLPPLPPTDDPYALLGVEPDADERTLKRAYARLIKQYRPDRAPKDFARIHAAFEAAQQGAAMLALVTDREPSGADAAPPTPSADGDGAAARPEPNAEVEQALIRLATAVEAADDAAAQAAWSAALAAGGNAEALIVGAPDAVQRWLMTRPPIRWRDLSTWKLQADAFYVWVQAFLARIEERARLAEAVEMAGEDALIDDAGHEPAAAVLVLKAISCLAWLDPEAARNIGRRLKKAGFHPAVDALFDRATVDAVAGLQYQAAGRPPLPPELVALLSRGPFMSQPAHRAQLARIRKALEERPTAYMAELAAAVKNRPQLREALELRLRHGLPMSRYSFARLDVKRRAQFLREMQAINDRTGWIMSSGISLAVVGAVIGIAQVAGEAWKGGLGHVAVILGLAGIIAAWVVPTIRRYGRDLRPRMLGAMMRFGVTLEAIQEWIHKQMDPVLGLPRYSWWIASDAGLRLGGLLAVRLALEAEADETAED